MISIPRPYDTVHSHHTYTGEDQDEELTLDELEELELEELTLDELESGTN
jgi:hypothetical protein